MRANRANRIAAALVLWAASAAVAQAAVEITQQVTLPDGKGGTKTETHKTTISGDRMKTITPRATMITDLQKGTMVVLDEKSKVATEMPIQTSNNPMANALIGDYKATGSKKTVGGYRCEEYTHSVTLGATEISSVTCVAKDAPGAAEASAFYRKMAEKMSGKKTTDALPQGIPVAEETKVHTHAMSVPGMSSEMAAKIAAAQASMGARKSEITSVKSVDVASSEFEVPTGYTKRTLEPHASGNASGFKPPNPPGK
jgi:Domain of unknown function (DUF4412)